MLKDVKTFKAMAQSTYVLIGRAESNQESSSDERECEPEPRTVKTLESMPDQFKKVVSKYWVKRKEMEKTIKDLESVIAVTQAKFSSSQVVFPTLVHVDSNTMDQWIQKCYKLCLEYEEDLELFNAARQLLTLTLEINASQRNLIVFNGRYDRFLREYDLFKEKEDEFRNWRTYMDEPLMRFVSYSPDTPPETNRMGLQGALLIMMQDAQLWYM